MGENTKIEWCDHTFNPWIGCAKVSAGCTNCYAETLMDKRMGKVQWGPNGTRVKTSASYWKNPLKWDRDAARDGVRRRVFCASLADVFEDRNELIAWRDELFALIAKTQHLDWLLLTKRPENANRLIGQLCWPDLGLLMPYGREGLPTNVWLGTSVENYETASNRIAYLLGVAAAVHWVSYEPCLKPIDFNELINEWGQPWSCFDPIGIDRRRVDWVIVGGESGPNARPMHPDWARSIRNQCQAAGVPFFFKQWGELIPYEFSAPPMIDSQHGDSIDRHWLPDGLIESGRQDNWLLQDGAIFRNIGKKAAGRLLDGREWNEFPNES